MHETAQMGLQLGLEACVLFPPRPDDGRSQIRAHCVRECARISAGKVIGQNQPDVHGARRARGLSNRQRASAADIIQGGYTAPQLAGLCIGGSLRSSPSSRHHRSRPRCTCSAPRRRCRCPTSRCCSGCRCPLRRQPLPASQAAPLQMARAQGRCTPGTPALQATAPLRLGLLRRLRPPVPPAPRLSALRRARRRPHLHGRQCCRSPAGRHRHCRCHCYCRCRSASRRWRPAPQHLAWQRPPPLRRSSPLRWHPPRAAAAQRPVTALLAAHVAAVEPPLAAAAPAGARHSA